MGYDYANNAVVMWVAIALVAVVALMLMGRKSRFGGQMTAAKTAFMKSFR